MRLCNDEGDKSRGLFAQGGGTIHGQLMDIVRLDKNVEKNENKLGLREYHDRKGSHIQCAAMENTCTVEQILLCKSSSSCSHVGCHRASQARLELGASSYNAEAGVGWGWQKLQVARNAALSAQHTAIARTQEARKCSEELEDAEDQFGVAQFATNTSSSDAKAAREEVSKLKTKYVAKVCHWQDIVGKVTKQLRRQARLVATESYKLVAVHHELESRMTKA